MTIKTTIQFRRDTLTNWSSANPVLKAGEVALVDKNNGVGSKLWAIRIGDGTTAFNDLPETAYALSADVASIGDGVLSDAKAYTDQVSAALETEISNKVKIEGVATDYINVSRVNAETYHDIITNGTADPKTIYIVSSDNVNAFGERVMNVGDATEPSDAVNLKQLNGTKTELTTLVSSVSSDLQKKIDDIEAGSTEIVSSVSAALTSTINTVSATLSNAIAAEVDTRSGEVQYLSSAITAEVETRGSEVTFLSGNISALDGSLSAYEVGVSALGRTGDVYKYRITQGGVSKGEIEVPYDVFVDKGEVKKIGDKTYLLLTLNNADSTVLSIDSTDLIDVYTAQNKTVAEGGTVDVAIDNYKVSAGVIDGSITAAKLGANSVTTEKIVDSAVDTAKLADNSVTTAKIVDGNVTAAKLSTDSVTTVKIADANVTTAKLADGAVTNAKLADAAVDTAQVVDGAITPVKMDATETFVFDCGGAAG